MGNALFAPGESRRGILCCYDADGPGDVADGVGNGGGRVERDVAILPRLLTEGRGGASRPIRQG